MPKNGDLHKQQDFSLFGALGVVAVLIAGVGGALAVPSICEST